MRRRETYLVCYSWRWRWSWGRSVLWLGDISFSPSATVFVSDFPFRSILVHTLLPLRLCVSVLTNVPLCFCFFLSHLFWSPVFSLSLCSSSFSPLSSLDSLYTLSVCSFLFAFSFSLSSCSLSSGLEFPSIPRLKPHVRGLKTFCEQMVCVCVCIRYERDQD